MGVFSFFRHLWFEPWTRWIGLRYLKSKKNSRFLSFITLLSVLGVGLGVASMIVVLSVMDGFEAELKKRLMGTDLHILITPTSEVAGFENGMVPAHALHVQDFVERLSHRKQVETFYPVLSTELIMKVGRKVTGAVFKGVPPERLQKVQELVTERVKPEEEKPGAITLPGILVGQELAYDMGLVPGDVATLISPTETEGPMSSVPRLKKFRVEGIYHSGLPEQELHTIFASTTSVESFLRKANLASQWEVTVHDFDEAPEIAEEIRAEAPGFRVQDWIQLNSNLFWSLRLERIAMFVILAFIVVVASFNIVTTLTLMVLEKKREISILRAVGAREASVAAIFLSEGLLIGGLGIAGGLGLGFVICVVLRNYEIIELPDVFYDRTLPVTFDGRYYLGVAIVALVIVLSACLYPSRRAARLDPLEGIRFG